MSNDDETTNTDRQFMRLALELAARGRGGVEPNPMVGAVIARDGVEIARGYHERFGGPHAEVVAMAAARSAGKSIDGATMYVTLEPCCHYGKTPPCCDAVAGAGLGRVVVAMLDPDKRVSGGGVAALRKAGVAVEVGLMERQARELLAPYIKLRTLSRPWVICKWAQTAEGFLTLGCGCGDRRADMPDLQDIYQAPLPPAEDGRTPPAPRRQWVSNQQSRAYAHRVRGLCDGILVGINTIIADDPLLTNRSQTGGSTSLTAGGSTSLTAGGSAQLAAGGSTSLTAGRQPTRIVLDSALRIPLNSRIVQSVHESSVIVATSEQAIAAKPAIVEALERAGVELRTLPPSPLPDPNEPATIENFVPGPGGLDLGALLDNLGQRQWTYLLVEGGQRVLESFIYGQFADELLVFRAPFSLGPENTPEGVRVPRLDIRQVQTRINLREIEHEDLDGDAMMRFRVENQSGI
jgi:diaminohydroxyphosphoribosylaminopyrimidine deaminase/5-amino-6-(5-phosphoribosylamino)uracil reductase